MQVFVPGPVLLQVACGSHPPLFVRHESTGAQTVPVPEYPAPHLHVFVPGPVDVQVACGSQAPTPAVQLLIGAHVLPSPE